MIFELSKGKSSANETWLSLYLKVDWNQVDRSPRRTERVDMERVTEADVHQEVEWVREQKARRLRQMNHSSVNYGRKVFGSKADMCHRHGDRSAPRRV